MQPLILFNKPFDVLTGFAGHGERVTLSHFLKAPGYHPAGRLDNDSEGLLLLTNDGRLQARLTHPKWKVPKIYFVQVESVPNPEALEQLRHGVLLSDGPTLPAEVESVAEPGWLWPRSPAIRFRRNIPTTWLKIGIREGRNRQVRRMTAAAGHPTLRLVRWSVGPWSLEGLAPGEWRYATAAELRSFVQRL